jgi:hypothetical protein
MPCQAVKSVMEEVQNVLSSYGVGYGRGAECFVQLWSLLYKWCRMPCPLVRGLHKRRRMSCSAVKWII